MDFLPILSTLRRHRTAAGLIVLEIALTCAIVCNAVFLIGERLSRMDRASGVAEEEVVRLELGAIGKSDNAVPVTAQDLVALRGIPGVKAVSAANMVPYGNSSWNTTIKTSRDDEVGGVNSAFYMGGEQLLDGLGVPVVAGRNFTPDDVVAYADVQAGKVRPSVVIVTRGLAEHFFPGQDPLGKSIYASGDTPQTIVGVIERLARPNDANGPALAAFTVVLPVRLPYTVGGNYVLRVDPARGAEVLTKVDGVLNQVDPARIILHRQTFSEMRRDYFKQDRAMSYLLAGVTIALLIVTALGIVGLAGFWVQQRQRQIGIRRALGASRGDIVRYFQVENFILTTLGVVLGMALAYAFNLWLIHAYQVPRLPAVFLPVGAVLLWGLGQLAVLSPALRASRISPAIATRST